MGGRGSYPGCLGTGVAKLLPSLNAGRTGLTEQQAKTAGLDAVSATAVLDDKAHYYPGASSFVVKLVAERESRRLLGLQVLGAGAVDKMTDIAVLALSQNAKLGDFDTMAGWNSAASVQSEETGELASVMENAWPAFSSRRE